MGENQQQLVAYLTHNFISLSRKWTQNYGGPPVWCLCEFSDTQGPIFPLCQSSAHRPMWLFDCCSLSHHVWPRRKRKGWRGPLLPKSEAALDTPISHWPRHFLVTTPRCKSGWETGTWFQGAVAQLRRGRLILGRWPASLAIWNLGQKTGCREFLFSTGTSNLLHDLLLGPLAQLSHLIHITSLGLGYFHVHKQRY